VPPPGPNVELPLTLRPHRIVWPGGVVVTALDLRLKRSPVRISAVPVSGNNLGHVVHIHMPLSPNSIIWYPSSGGDALQLGR